MARFVGEEAFALKVGQALIKRSAEVGLRVDGIVTNSGLDASKVINQPLQDVHIDKHEAFAVPLSDAIALFGAVNELTLLRRQAFEAMKSQGVSDREAMEVLNKPEVKKQIITMAERKEKLQQEALKIQEKFEQAKVEAAQPLYDTEDILVDDDSRSLTYQIVLNQEQEAKENFARKAEAEYRQELREIDTLSKASWGRATPEFLRVTARQKLLDATVSWGCQYIPFYQHFHNLLESEFMEALKGGTVEAALWMIPVGKVAEFLTKPIAKPVMKILEKQAKRYGAKVVDKLPNLFKNPDVMKRGLEYENYVAESVPGRLQPNHPTFDFFNRETRHATSVKSMDTQTAAKLANPKQIYQTMKRNIDKAVNYNGKGVVQVRPEEILSRELRVGIPIETNPSQWQQIQRAIEYGRLNKVDVIIEALK